MTGAAGTIGRVAARQLIESGHSVVGVDLDDAGLQEVAGQLGDRFHPLRADLGSEAGIGHCCDRITERHGTVRVLINNAGIMATEKFLDTTLASLRRVLAGTAYSLSKSAMIGLTYSLAREFGPMGISTTAIAPAFVRSDMMASAFKAPDAEEKLVASIPLRRLCSPEEVASAITYLASELAGFINGEVIDINGGVQCD